MQDDLVELADEPQEIPVYLFTGFLEAGKTKFIQETLCDKRFNRGERMLVLMCEEGEEELDPSAFPKKGRSVFLRTLDGEEDLTEQRLARWQSELEIERVVVEYNGMWMLDSLYNAMPAGWTVYQEFMFADANTFINYNNNMRQLVFDKLQSCELVVFNRAPKGIDMTPYHKIIRAVNRRCDIAFEHPDGKVEYDETVDPLPFDINAPVVEIADRDYAIWYQDMGEEMKKYSGKTLKLHVQVASSPDLPRDTIIVGRQMMNCCAADVQFAGLAATGTDSALWQSGDWIFLTAKVRIGRHKAYSGAGPILEALVIEPAEPAAETVATFY